MRRVSGLLGLAAAACLLTLLAFPTVAAAKRPGPTPSPTPSATPTPTPTPSPSPPPVDSAVTFQVNAAHTGAQSGDALQPPLARRWELDLGSAVSYPLVADGNVYVIAANADDTSGHASLFALDQRTGRSVWGPVSLPTAPGLPVNNALDAYDGGRVFVLQGNGLLRAFDSRTGALAWTTALPGQALADAPPTAVNGTVYVVGEDASAVTAVSEASGSVRWTTPVEIGGQGSPVVTGTDLYVSDDCNAYDLDPATGAQKWRHSSGCTTGSGLTPVLNGGLLYVRSGIRGGPDIVLDGRTGAQVGAFSADPSAAFDGGLGFFVVAGRLEAHDLTSGAVTWTFTERDALGFQGAGDDTLASAPVIAKGFVYVASTEGWVFAVAEATGRAAWSDRVGLAFQFPEFSALAVGQGGLAVPFGSTLVFYAGAPATTPSPQPTPGPDQAQSYLLNPQHTGGQDADPLRFPPVKRWTAATSGLPSYPLIAGGHVYFADGAKLLALNEADGSAAWGPVTLPQSSLLAYDGGAVFALGSGGALEALDAASGAQRWTAQLSGSAFHSYPVAANGSVYIAGGGALIALSEQSGAVLWSRSVLGSGDSSPVVTGTGVYLAYPCPEVYDFDPASGGLIWHVGPSSCTVQASGPRTAAIFDGRLYVRDTSTGLVLDAATGAQLGVFRSNSLPAFSGSMAFFAEESSVEGWDLTTGSLVWRWDGDPLQENTPTCPSCPPRAYLPPTGPPVVVNGFVLFSLGQNAYALDGRTGRQVWTGVLGVSTDIGTISAGEGLLALAGGPTPAFPSALGAVTVYATGGTVNPPSPTAADEA
ncbi:MAG TPA: PQQ-binding-like beta-propeller repeat protein, partial [Candidatus Dormibacteraeota bacterium]|nr:PQQ-binding-like beta-propeller repeat protein [Candidatus Dormibacteraeota bacterium]